MLTEFENKFRDCLFRLHTRKFGTINEIVISKYLTQLGYVVKKSKDGGKTDRQINNKKSEIKASRVLETNPIEGESKTLVEDIMSYVEVVVPFDKCEEMNYLCNIQQIKNILFDDLYYSVYFKDIILFFKATKQQMIDDVKNMKYSDRQHRGNKGEGQFGIKPQTIKYHMENYLIGSIEYSDMIELLGNEDATEIFKEKKSLIDRLYRIFDKIFKRN
jgi:hypothetical protein